jgi:misacylated tRNA(Ala) deacylase
MTIELFREDGYLARCESTVMTSADDQFSVDQTVFYPMGGGQPGDNGTVILPDKRAISIIDCRKDNDTGEILHILEAGAGLPAPGDVVRLEIDWDRRYRLMRMHSCMHMLCVAIDAPVTGGSIRDGSGRLDFDLPDPPTREELEQRLNEIISGNHAMSLSWITDQEMDQQPDLVRTMSVKPPVGSGQVRLVQFGEADLQACGGTHVANSSEIGQVRVASIKNKGKQNRRVTIEFA